MVISPISRMLLLGAALLTTGCAALSPYSGVTKLELTLTAQDDLNPDLNGRPSPAVVKIFELSHPVAFDNADFFDLYDRPAQSLGTDLLALEELELRPGDGKSLKLRTSAKGRYVAVLVAYRDVARSDWRYVVPIEPGQRSRKHLQLGRDGIQAQDAVASGEGRS